MTTFQTNILFKTNVITGAPRSGGPGAIAPVPPPTLIQPWQVPLTNNQKKNLENDGESGCGWL